MERTNQDRLDTLFLQWREAQARGQHVALDQLCEHDTELLSLLRARVTAALEETTPGPDDPSATSDQPRADTSSQSFPEQSRPVADPPKRLGQYEILGRLGQGGMGIVYKARQTGLDRIVAIKVLSSPDRPTDRALQRFRTEAQALARLHHPHIVHVYEVGEYQETPYLVMEYVNGGTLRELVRQAPLTPPVAADVTAKLARAMHAVHKQGIVHRDLKPANVLIAQDLDEGPWNTAVGCPKITDFGLVKNLERNDQLTSDGLLLGTVAYMAPEQARGDSTKIGPTTDIYALGAILYELLTGSPPFQGDNVLQLLDTIKSTPPVPILASRPDVPGILAAICERCLHKEPAQRFPTALNLAETLEKLSHPTASMPPLSPPSEMEQQNLDEETSAPPADAPPPPQISDLPLLSPSRRRKTTHTFQSRKVIHRLTYLMSIVLLGTIGVAIPVILTSPRVAHLSTGRIASEASPPTGPVMTAVASEPLNEDLTKLKGTWMTKAGRTLSAEIGNGTIALTIEEARTKKTTDSPFQLHVVGSLRYLVLDTTRAASAGLTSPEVEYRFVGERLVLTFQGGAYSGSFTLERVASP